MNDGPVVTGAARLAGVAHDGSVDKYGRPFFECHVIDVVHRVHAKGGAPEVVAAAYLHDVLEKTSTTLDDLAAAGMPERVRVLVTLLTHHPGQSRLEYLDQIRRDPDALLIKQADHEANADPVLIGWLPPEQRTALRRKYRDERRLLFPSE